MEQKEYVSTKELAEMLSVSKKFIEANRNSIPGAVKIGRCWRFNLPEIRRRLATGENLVDRRN